MKYKGVTYDIGTEYSPGTFTVDKLLPGKVSADLSAIKNDLHCNAIRIFGKDIEKLILAADIALEKGLNVWLSPRLIDAGIEETLNYLKDAAKAFQVLKNKFPACELVFIIGGELTIDMKGFAEGDTIYERIKNLLKPAFFLKKALGIRPGFQKKFDRFLADAVSTVRNEFSGKVTYASAMWENLDWKIFDIVSMNLYKASFNAHHFNKTLKKLSSFGKPVAITEFGCCVFEGADKRGPAGYYVLDAAKNPPVFKEKCIRSEKVQADYISDLLNIYDQNNVEATFVFDFQAPGFPHSPNPETDYDMASFAITKTADSLNWQPKESFYAIADFYKGR